MKYLNGLNLNVIFFGGLVFFAVLLKLALVSDFSVPIIYSPHDDGLYVSRAFYLLSGQAFGPYDARLLVKLPGVSFWLAGIRLLGIPYLFSINILYIFAGCYVITGLSRCGINKALLLIVFVLYLFNPVTFSFEWLRPLRDALSACLLVLLFGSMIFIFSAAREKRISVIHIVVFSVVFAFSLLLREEDVLLYGALMLFCAALVWQFIAHGALHTTVAHGTMVLIISLPLLMAYESNKAVRNFVAEHYGVPLIHELGEGEFPRLIAAMRGVESRKDNRLVMITQEALGEMAKEVPKLTPLIEKLPNVGPNTFSCRIYGVCTEWVNGWMVFWIKDAAFGAGLTPDLPSAQAYFRSAREDIERACKEKRLKCSIKGSGLVPPFELRWTRAYVQQWLNLLQMILVPHFDAAGETPTVYGVDVNYGRMYQFVTMTHNFDTQLQLSGSSGIEVPKYDNSLSRWREPIIGFYQYCGFIVVIGGLLAFLTLVRRREAWLDPFFCAAAVMFGYTVLRFSAMAYVLMYMGNMDMRVVFSTYVIVILVSPLLVAKTVRTLSAEQTLKNGSQQYNG